ncbi:uncharacterized protein LOC111103532 [Crassostrea virginica]
MPCTLGYFGSLCDTPCLPGFYGRHCGGSCHPLCSVEECDPRYGCKPTTAEIIQRTNSACKLGYFGILCEIPCLPGFYGKNCAGACHPLCTVDNCDPMYRCKLTTAEISQEQFQNQHDFQRQEGNQTSCNT